VSDPRPAASRAAAKRRSRTVGTALFAVLRAVDDLELVLQRGKLALERLEVGDVAVLLGFWLGSHHAQRTPVPR